MCFRFLTGKYLQDNLGQENNCGTVKTLKECIKRYNNKLWEFIKYEYSLQKLYFGTLETLVSKKATVWQLSKSQSNDKL